jgi:hypothetical protein
MKVTLSGVKFSIGFLILFLGSSGGFLHAQTSAFNYQGRLTEGLGPANGDYDLEFRAFDAATGGNQVGTTRSAADIAVTNGIFSVSIDFGAAAFPGADRWLEVRVRPGASTGPFTTLGPRQPIAGTPYAVRSINASNASQLGGVAADQYIQATDQRLVVELSTSSGFMVSGVNRVGFCNEGSCRFVDLNGVTATSTAQCGADGCMIPGNGQVVYCNKDICITTDVPGATITTASIRCGGDGCMVPGPNQIVYCSQGSCQVFVIQGVTTNTGRCSQDGCMIPATDQVVYCRRGTCRTENASGVSASAATVVCGERGCIAPAVDRILYCFQGSCQLLSLVGVRSTTNIAAFVK